MELSECKVWWNGPEWLAAEATEGAEVPLPKECIEELIFKIAKPFTGL